MIDFFFGHFPFNLTFFVFYLFAILFHLPVPVDFLFLPCAPEHQYFMNNFFPLLLDPFSLFLSRIGEL